MNDNAKLIDGTALGAELNDAEARILGGLSAPITFDTRARMKQ